ncbi:MAG: hypothetical protein HKN72_08450 [Gemmatimonadetes bacterium]|nr:hypothetical protein [Gemmatimonadota bacterium]NNL30456.1 hypothetical protein [Gemmatimonadota bacterium]
MSIFDSIKRLFGGAGASDDNGRGPGRVAGTRAAEGAEMISCEQALRLVHDFLDGELGDVPAEQVRRHFEVCGQCYPHLKLESAYREAVRRAAAGQEAPDALKDRVSQLLTEARASD